jgi:NAD(P)-dependent dehydrogenase (short-subunit alcohol dehydrogenase family)
MPGISDLEYSGHFYFTKLLIPALLAGSISSSDGKARVVNISSVAAYMAKSFDLDMVQDLPQRMRSSPNYLYAQSKLVCLPVYDEPCHSYQK